LALDDGSGGGGSESILTNGSFCIEFLFSQKIRGGEEKENKRTTRLDRGKKV
jgi:hypothetical protein